MKEASRHKHIVMCETCNGAGAQKHLSGPRCQVQCHCVRTLVELYTSSVILQSSVTFNSTTRSARRARSEFAAPGSGQAEC